MELIFQGIWQALVLLCTFDRETWGITFLSLQISGAATLVSLFIGMGSGITLALNDFPGAIRDYDVLIRRKRGLLQAYFFKGLCLRQLKQYRSALANLEKAMRYAPASQRNTVAKEIKTTKKLGKIR